MAINTATGATRGSTLVGGTLSAILKEYYLPGIVDQLNSKTILRRRLKRRSDGVEGKYCVIDLNVGRNTGYGYVGEGGRLPDPKAQQFKQAQYSLRYSYGRIKFTGPSSSAARTDRGSFVRVMDAEINGMSRDVLHNDNRVMFGNGTGRIAQIASVSGSTYTLKNPGGEVSTGLGTQYIESPVGTGSGMTVGVLTAANEGTVAINVANNTNWRLAGSSIGSTISAVDYAAGTVTMSTVHTGAAANEYLYLVATTDAAGTGVDTARGNEPNGLAAIIDDADPVFQSGSSGFWPQGLGAIPTSTTPVWRAGVIDNGGIAVPFSPDMFQRAMDLADLNGDGVVSAWYTTHGIRRQYLNTLVANKRFNDTMVMDGGFSVLTWDGRPIFVDKDCQRGRIYGLSEENIWIAQETDYFWLDQDGSILRRLDDYDAFQATLAGYWQLVTDARNRHVTIQDIQDV